jgi:hypothetical protein
MPAKGNHDSAFFNNVFRLPTNGVLPGVYSFDYADAHFVVLDSAFNSFPVVADWLRRDLQKSDSKWKFVMFHYPAYYAFDDGRTGIFNAIRENWSPIMEENMVDLAFVGHQHMYVRTKPTQARKDAAIGQDLVYIMGVSGSKLYAPDTKEHDYLDVVVPFVSNYQVISIEGDLLTLRSIDDTGREIDFYQIDKTLPEDPCSAGHDLQQVATAGCWSGGWLKKACTGCIYEENIGWQGALGHAYEVVKTTQATCWSGGGDYVKCTRCSYETIINWYGAIFER